MTTADPTDDEYDNLPELDELKLIPTPDLVNELGKRFQNLVFLGQGDITLEGASYLHGNFYTCLGLVAAQYSEMCAGPTGEEV